MEWIILSLALIAIMSLPSETSSDSPCSGTTEFLDEAETTPDGRSPWA